MWPFYNTSIYLICNNGELASNIEWELQDFIFFFDKGKKKPLKIKIHMFFY